MPDIDIDKALKEAENIYKGANIPTSPQVPAPALPEDVSKTPMPKIGGSGISGEVNVPSIAHEAVQGKLSELKKRREELQSNISNAFTKPIAPVRTGIPTKEDSLLSAGWTGLQGAVANIPEFAAKGVGLVSKEGAKPLHELASKIAPSKEQEEEVKRLGLKGEIAAAVGGMLPGMIPYMGATKILSMLKLPGLAVSALGFAGVEAISRSPEGWQASLKAASMGAFSGGVLHYLGPSMEKILPGISKDLPEGGWQLIRAGQRRLVKMPIMAALFGGQTYAETGDLHQAIPSMVVALGLASLHGKYQGGKYKAGQLFNKEGVPVAPMISRSVQTRTTNTVNTLVDNVESVKQEMVEPRVQALTDAAHRVWGWQPGEEDLKGIGGPRFFDKAITELMSLIPHKPDMFSNYMVFFDRDGNTYLANKENGYVFHVVEHTPGEFHVQKYVDQKGEWHDMPDPGKETSKHIDILHKGQYGLFEGIRNVSGISIFSEPTANKVSIGGPDAMDIKIEKDITEEENVPVKIDATKPGPGGGGKTPPLSPSPFGSGFVFNVDTLDEMLARARDPKVGWATFSINDGKQVGDNDKWWSGSTADTGEKRLTDDEVNAGAAHEHMNDPVFIGESKKTGYVGVYRDNNGKIVVEPSRPFDDFQKAMQYAQDTHQESIAHKIGMYYTKDYEKNPENGLWEKKPPTLEEALDESNKRSQEAKDAAKRNVEAMGGVERIAELVKKNQENLDKEFNKLIKDIEEPKKPGEPESVGSAKAKAPDHYQDHKDGNLSKEEAIDAINKQILSTKAEDGSYRGSPGLRTAKQLQAWRETLRGYVQEGAAAIDWYERSGKQILAFFEGNVDRAEQFIKQIALLSPRAPVSDNFNWAINSLYGLEKGEDVKVGRAPNVMGKRAGKVFAGEEFNGRKVNSFYKNLMHVIDPERFPEGPVAIDMWMLRGLSYITDPKHEVTTRAQYDFMEREVQKLALELGIKPHQAQSAIWVAEKARWEMADNFIKDQARARGWKVNGDEHKDLKERTFRKTWKSFSPQVVEQYIKEGYIHNFADRLSATGLMPSGLFFDVSNPTIFMSSRNLSHLVSAPLEYEQKDLFGTKFYQNTDKQMGFALDSEGHLTTVYNNSENRNATKELIMDALHKGARTVDVPEGHMIDLFKDLGFRVLRRFKFEEQNVPKGWNAGEQGRPDIIRLAYRGPKPTGDFETFRRTILRPTILRITSDEIEAFRQSSILAERSQEGATMGSAEQATASGRGQAPGELKDLGAGKRAKFVHFGKYPDTEELDPAFHGTGKPGRERERAAAYPGLFVPRTYVYMDKIYTKEPGLGAYEYRGEVKNMLDPDSPDGRSVFAEARELMDRYGTDHTTMIEHVAYERGYDGIGWIGPGKDQGMLFKKTQAERYKPGEPRSVGAAGVGGEITEEAKTAFKESTSTLKNAWDGIKRLLAPTTRGLISRITGEDISRIHSGLERHFDQIEYASRDAWKAFNKMSIDEKYDFSNRMSTGTEVPDALKPIAKVLKDALRFFGEWAKQFDPDMKLRVNYWPGGPYVKDATGKWVSSAPKSFEGAMDFMHSKKFQTYAEALEGGKIPVYDNPVDQAMHKIRQLGQYIMAHKSIDDAVGRYNAMEIKSGETKPEGWKWMPEPFGTTHTGRYAMEPHAADVFHNAFMVKPMGSNPYLGDLYRGYMKASTTMNMGQLFGVFHGGFVAVESSVSTGAVAYQQLYRVLTGRESISTLFKTMGKVPISPIEKYMKGKELIRGWYDPSSVDAETRSVLDDIALGGGAAHIDKLFQTSHTETMVNNYKQGKYVSAAAKTPFALLEQGMRPIIDHVVPNAKFGAFKELRDDWLRSHPNPTFDERQAEMHRIWTHIDSRLGQVNWDRYFINPTARAIMHSLVRAAGWTGGTIAEIGGSVKDTAKFVSEWAKTGKAPTALPHRTAYVLSLATFTAVTNGLLTYLLTGEFPKDKDFIAFRTGEKDEHGRDQRALMPSYAKDVYAWATSPLATVWHKANPLISILSEMIKNKDYYGTRVYDPESGIGAKIGDIGTYLAKAMEPFSVRGYKKEIESGVGGVKAALPLIGVMPAPAYMQKSAAENKATELGMTKMASMGRPKEAYERNKLINEYAKQYRVAMSKGEDTGPVMEKISQDLESHKLKRQDIMTFKKRIQGEPLAESVKRLNIKEAMTVYNLANEAEKRKIIPIIFKKYRNLKDPADKEEFMPIMEKISNELSKIYIGGE